MTMHLQHKIDFVGKTNGRTTITYELTLHTLLFQMSLGLSHIKIKVSMELKCQTNVVFHT